MKKIILAITIVILSSCNSRVKDAYAAYLDYESAVECKDTVKSEKLKKVFTDKAIHLETADLNELELMIRKRKEGHKKRAMEYAVKNRRVSNILNIEANE